jgi:folate-binding protein YgfZ
MLYFCKIKSDFLKFEGSDRLDLINRLSTNEVNSLGKFKGVKTILTTDKGRFVDLITLYNFGDFIFVKCSYGNTDAVLNHLEKYTIMDDFKAVNMAGTHEIILFYGAGFNELSKELFNIDTSGFANNDFAVYAEENRPVMAARNDDAFGGCHFIYDVKDKDYWEKKIFNESVKSKYELSELRQDEYETKRIEHGIPGFGKEMTDFTNPLECGLNSYVSFTKGCYIGQEVIARLDAYDKINKHMVGVLSEQEIPIAKISVDGKECGFTTSTAHSQKFGNIGLGFVKTIFLDLEKEYKIKSEDKLEVKLVDCKITELPFNLN